MARKAAVVLVWSRPSSAQLVDFLLGLEISCEPSFEVWCWAYIGCDPVNVLGRCPCELFHHLVKCWLALEIFPWSHLLGYFLADYGPVRALMRFPRLGVWPTKLEDLISYLE